MKLKTSTKIFLIIVALTFFWGLAYAIPQQILRRGANNPQTQIAKASALSVAQGEVPDFLVKNPKQVDIGQSALPYLIIFDQDKKVMASTAILGTQNPLPPLGVLDYAKKHGVDRVTWQPVPGVRQALVAMPYSGKYAGFVVSGRSLAQTEQKEDLAFKIDFWGWIISMIILGGFGTLKFLKMSSVKK